MSAGKNIQEKKLPTGENDIYYRVIGAGEPVVLIHGFGEDGRIWEPLLSLGEQYRLIIPDLPGSGQSAADISGITIEAMAEHINAVIEAEKIDPCSVIGHSMGGYITLALAEKYPQKLNRIGLFHSTAFADNEDKKAARKKNIDFIRNHGAQKFLQQSVPNLFAPETVQKNPSLIQQTLERYSYFNVDSLIHYTTAMMNRPDRIPVLESFPKPVLFIMGEHDTAIPLEQGLKQCHIPEFSYIYICVHSGHMGMLEESGFCLQAMQDFLAGS